MDREVVVAVRGTKMVMLAWWMSTKDKGLEKKLMVWTHGYSCGLEKEIGEGN